MKHTPNQLDIDNNLLNQVSFRLSDDVLYSEVENEAILLHVSGGTYYNLSETSLPFWEALQNQQPLQPVVEKIANEYEVQREQVLNDLQAFLQDLSKLGLISKTSN
ncbi:Coenzyme PQQ synthesis protein D (PqqD) [Rivularia sp. PCC 7116]|uniref:PqqD family protein n=1 Tax=Rivularia sp. PCC 7116 TaxID=373994 RepID=UPI00029F3CC7|nr:PqqD family protein [Rivularia sp. PCC 7116]AFY56936.1 Coenzyme PQQ synthesis protein D (PqqD) [Rivularia sp. PCC 7116]